MVTITKVSNGQRKMQEQVDRLGTVREQKKALETEEKELVEALREYVVTKADLPDTESRQYEGKDFGMVVGAKALVRTVDNEAMFTIMGKGPFLQIVKVSMTDAEKYLTPDQQKVVIKSKRTGTRSLKCTRKAPAVQGA